MVGSDIQAGYNIVFIYISYLGNETLYMLFILTLVFSCRLLIFVNTLTVSKILFNFVITLKVKSILL